LHIVGTWNRHLDTRLAELGAAEFRAQKKVLVGEKDRAIGLVAILKDADSSGIMLQR